MKTHLDCIPCFVRQTLEAAKVLKLDDEVATVLIHRVLGLLQELDWSTAPPVIGRDVQRLIREVTGDEDPYLSAKISNTKRALELLTEVEEAILDAEDPFLAATKFSIAGNAIDLGAKTGMDTDIDKLFQGALEQPVDSVAFMRFKEALSGAKNVLFLADNAGEIVFDRPLLNFIGRDKVTVGVRGSPVLNDATMDDAKRSGVFEQFRTISNGSDTPGTFLPDCCDEFVHQFETADLVLSKGQGNYETLCDSARNVTFLFLTKCPLVSREVGVPVGTYVIEDR